MGPEDLDPDEYQRLAEDPRPGDDHTTVITARLAEKCAAIIRARSEGHDLYEHWIPHVVGYLSNAAFLARRPEQTHITDTVAELARELDAVPWPQVGPPKPQPD